MPGSEADEVRQMLDAIQLYLDYCLTGHTSSKAIFIWYGPRDRHNAGSNNFGHCWQS